MRTPHVGSTGCNRERLQPGDAYRHAPHTDSGRGKPRPPASASVAQTGGNTGDGDQQRLFQGAVLRGFAGTGACQQLGLQ